MTDTSRHSPSERAEYERLLAEFVAHYHPAGPEEYRLVVNVVENTIRGRRAHAMEAALFEQAILEKEDGVDPASA